MKLELQNQGVSWQFLVLLNLQLHHSTLGFHCYMAFSLLTCMTWGHTWHVSLSSKFLCIKWTPVIRFGPTLIQYDLLLPRLHLQSHYLQVIFAHGVVRVSVYTCFFEGHYSTHDNCENSFWLTLIDYDKKDIY